MNKIFKTIMASVVLGCMHTMAGAAVVDFNADPAKTAATENTPIVSGEYSFRTSSLSAIINGDTLPFGVSNGSNMLVFDNIAALTITRSDSGLFALGSLDAGIWNGVPGSGSALSVIGHRQGAADVVITPASVLSSTSFAHVTTTPDFTNLTSLTISMTGYTSTAYSAIDNLVLTAVPEPETYALFLAGLGLVGVIARRRKSS